MIEGDVIGAGRRVKELREMIGVSAKSLSLATGFSHNVVWQLESGYLTRPCADLIVNLAMLLGTSAEWLMRGVGSPPTPEKCLAAYILVTEQGFEKEDRSQSAA